MPSLSTPEVHLINNRLVTTSLKVAEAFGKRHSHVIDKIKSIDCSEQFLTSNFSAVKYNHRGNEYDSFEMTKDGFMFLVMGFTGKKAAQIKEAYINAFNLMEAQLRNQPPTPPPCPKTSEQDMFEFVAKTLKSDRAEKLGMLKQYGEQKGHDMSYLPKPEALGEPVSFHQNLQTQKLTVILKKGIEQYSLNIDEFVRRAKEIEQMYFVAGYLDAGSDMQRNQFDSGKPLRLLQ
ncbi:Rha family transcriptional regulator [Marinibactrum halimedae]|uniref:Rha family transcriptional regulator n=1 Tax=Marinibactrum halimedae TaxID=1444977 RepID=A0AA37T6A1_9GAMM|nr:Rha family transcriptional regulator [Marinibactrum halimedae]MCD9458870.1 Rha family transcriptional regulator [Marinibactrum halimedae]GLS27720.1 hypothetical protein GCM10007877_34390 [Marinibactrum halimedae]